MKSKLRSSCISNPFEFVFFGQNRSDLCWDDTEALRRALNEAADKFKTKAPLAVRTLSERYVERHGYIPKWSYKFFERLATKIKDRDLRNYLIALTTRDEKS